MLEDHVKLDMEGGRGMPGRARFAKSRIMPEYGVCRLHLRTEQILKTCQRRKSQTFVRCGGVSDVHSKKGGS